MDVFIGWILDLDDRGHYGLDLGSGLVGAIIGWIMDLGVWVLMAGSFRSGLVSLWPDQGESGFWAWLWLGHLVLG